MPTKKVAAKKAPKTVAKKTAVKKAVTKKAPTKKVAVKKPAPKKVTPKKSVTKGKKSTTKKRPTKELMFASDEQSFWVSNGEILNSLNALHDALGHMEREVFEFHATGEQNDFSVWVATVLCDGECAADLAKAKSQKSAKTAVAKHLKRYAI